VGFAVVGVEQPIKPRLPAEMQEQPDLDLGATQVVQEFRSASNPSSHGNCPSGPVLVCDEPLGCSSSVLRTGHHFVALRRRTVMRRFEIGKDHKITHSIGRRPRKTLTCTLPSNLRSIRAAWRPRSSRPPIWSKRTRRRSIC